MCIICKIKVYFLVFLKIQRFYVNGSGNAVNKPHIDIIYRFYVKVERTILYIQMLLTN